MDRGVRIYSDLGGIFFSISAGYSNYGITWMEIWDDRELMKLEGAEAINQLEELANIVKYPQQKIQALLNNGMI